MSFPMVHLSKALCPACSAGRHEHRSPYGCGRMMGSDGMCACKAQVTTPICGRCKDPIEGEPRVSSAEFIHHDCSGH
jgi:hypothetical protein